MAKQSKRQKEIVGRVMHEFRHGELETAGGRTVKNPKQAIAIGLSEAGASNRQGPSENKRRLARTKEKERRGETASQQKEKGEPTKKQLYEEAKKRGIEGGGPR